MADPLGIIGAIGVAAHITHLLMKLGLDWKSAPADARAFVDELQTLKTVLSETNTNLILNPDFVEAFHGRHSAVLSQLDKLFSAPAFLALAKQYSLQSSWTISSRRITLAPVLSIQTTDDIFSSLLRQLSQKTTSVFGLLEDLHNECSKVDIRYFGSLQPLSTHRIRANQEDVEAYMEANLNKLPSCVQKSGKLQGEIKSAISQAVDGMFLLAHIYLDSLDDKLTPRKVRTALAKIRNQNQGRGEDERAHVLSQAYDQAMERINSQRSGSRKLALLVLAWITFAKAPLSAIELQHALAVEVGGSELHEDNMPQVEDMVSICAGLVTLDVESKVVRLVHYTTQEYLRQKRNFWGLDPEAEIATACITYMSLESFRPVTSRGHLESKKYEYPDELLRLHPLYRYAARNWGYHIQGASKSCPGMLEFLQSTEAVAASIAITYTAGSYGFLRHHHSGGLHLASWFGIQEVVDTQWVEGLLESSDPQGRTPISWAAENGQEQMVKRLLEKGARPDPPIPMKLDTKPTSLWG
ncbi:hypothetical protein B0J13DRAFT_635874 [Dactylonectria estremocensis]|uniref:GPI inositol-deacylase winged helix domain-containing protein n=1 Tax=Dactylonectria estremocensis TaxID=1079267 RepID=A0A9P9J363_9HYPO|nr:hypothetical protein B0J13DRAFT_635874 [Dactylonectria estremocensis]